ncbi:MAG TPA: hypothetical protein VMX55_06725 [candidate division Zixibacteria bacterium]|nr:hypothetical protein [candidate division Zixibacteria bacterium]
MDRSLEEIAFEINNSTNKMIILEGVIGEFDAHNLANDFNYSYLDFDSFLKDNKIDSRLFKGPEKETNIRISIDNWTQKVAYAEQKGTIIIDGFDLRKIDTLLTKSLLNQELLYLSKNNFKLKTNLVFVINTAEISLENQILPKILENCKIIIC